uniref:AAA family ATPase n=1 Tax=Mimivirus LCMiAC01 TaxID=2506608 RepID=A0A481Z0A9_9VIRU|nr:MAG: AAA family ATPase [Mimivirus LCMiAC01]
MNILYYNLDDLIEKYGRKDSKNKYQSLYPTLYDPKKRTKTNLVYECKKCKDITINHMDSVKKQYSKMNKIMDNIISSFGTVSTENKSVQTYDVSPTTTPTSTSDSNDDILSYDDMDYNYLADKYYFYYKKIHENDDTIYELLIFDDEIARNLRDIIDDPDLYKNIPTIQFDLLYSNINNIKIKYNEKKYRNFYVKRILDFTNELFRYKYDRLDNMIKNNIIDYSSLWYYFNRSYYKVKHFDDYVCVKVNYCTYKKIESGEVFLLYCEIIYPHDDELYTHEYIHKIKKFPHVKNIDNLDVHKIEDIDSSIFIKYGDMMLNMYNKIIHMNISGKQYSTRNDDVLISNKNEQVMVDCVGMNKYTNIPLNIIPRNKINVNNITDKQKMIIFPYPGIYNMGINKKWGITHIKCLSNIIYCKDAFNCLSIDESKKNIIKNLINGKEKFNNSCDFINKKGNGLTFLLYGSSGLGKCFTVESICEFLGRPLYNIDINDIGTDSDNIENIMNNIFKYTKRWNAILLIRYVDIYMEKRMSGYINRNSITSIFLKILEYYNGILFLITNKINNLDPCVVEKIDMMFMYNTPDIKNGTNIWKSLLNKFDLKLNDDTIKKLATYKLNGRKIRNYIKIVCIIHTETGKPITNKSFYKTFMKCYKINHETDMPKSLMYN